VKSRVMFLGYMFLLSGTIMEEILLTHIPTKNTDTKPI